jgi:hypothetical protein
MVGSSAVACAAETASSTCRARRVLCFAAEVADSVGEDVGGEGAGFESVHVAVDGRFGLGDLGFGGSQLVLLLGRGAA